MKEQNSLSTFVVRVGKRKNCEQKFAFCFVLVREKMVEWMRIKRCSDDFNVGWKVSTDQLRHRWIAQKRPVSMLVVPKKCFQHMKQEDNHKRCKMFTLSLWIHLKETPNKDIAQLESFKNSGLVQKRLGGCDEASWDEANISSEQVT